MGCKIDWGFRLKMDKQRLNYLLRLVKENKKPNDQINYEITFGLSEVCDMLGESKETTNKQKKEFVKYSNVFKSFAKIHKSKIKKDQEVDEDTIIAKVLQKLPSQSNHSVTPVSFDEEALISKILTRVPSGAKVYEVAPLEKIKKDFLEHAKNKILSDIEQLSPEQKKVLKYLESQARDVSPSEIITKCLLLKMGGSQSVRVSNILKGLRSIEVIDKTAGGRNRGILKDKIKNLLENHDAKEEEIQQVYDHILMEMLK